MDSKKPKKKAPKVHKKINKSVERDKTRKPSDVLAAAINAFESRLGEKDFKPTIGDYLKLLQMEKELEQERGPREIKVTWIEPEATSNVET